MTDTNKMDVEPVPPLKDEPLNAEYNRGWKDGYKQGAFNSDPASALAALRTKLAEAQAALKMAQSEAAAWRLTTKSNQEELETVWRLNDEFRKERDAAQAENKRLLEALESIHNLSSGSENLNHLIEIAARAALKGDV